MKKIIILTQYFPPEIGGGSQRSYGFAKELSQLGMDVTIVTPFPSYLMKKEDVKTRFKLFETKKIDGLNTYQSFVIANDRGGFFKRIIYYLSFTVSSIIVSLTQIKKFDYILTISPPLFTGISGVILKKIKSAKLIFDIGDLWPESVVQLGFLKNRFAIKVAEKIEKWIYNNSDIINTVTKKTLTFLSEKHQGKLNLNYAPNFVDTVNIKKMPKDDQILNELELKNKIIYGYAGNLGSAQGVKIIIDAAKITKEFKDLVYLVIGEGVDKSKLEQEIVENNLKNVKLLPPVSKDDIFRYISLFDVMIIPLIKNELFKITIPSKLYESMAAEIPVLLCVDGEARKIVEDAQCGIFVQPENHEMLAKEIIDLYNNGSRLKEFGIKGRIFAESKFDRKKVINDFYLNHLNGII